MNAFNKIEELLINKKFSELDSREIAIVLQEMTAKEYQEQRTLILSSIQLGEEILPTPPSSEDILSHLRNRGVAEISSNEEPTITNHSSTENSWTDRLYELLNIRIPAWQVALGTIVIGLMLYPMFDKERINTEVMTPYVAIIDTVSEHVVTPIMNTIDSNNLFAIGAKLVDSNYLRVSDYNRTRQRKDVNTEMLMTLTPIEL